MDVAIEQVAADGTVVCGDAVCPADGRAVIWMLDLDDDGWPTAAHQVVSKTATTAVTVCGRRETASSHPRGWRQRHPGDLPLAAGSVHCYGPEPRGLR